MAAQELAQRKMAGANARTAAEAYGDVARYLRAASEAAWEGPTGCSEWTLRQLAGHVAGEAVWFPNLVRGVTQGEPPLPSEHYASLKTLPPQRIADTIEQAATEIPAAIDEAADDHLQRVVDVGFMKLPLWRATALPVLESVYHHWDARVGRDPAATIPTLWAEQVATLLFEFAPMIANEDAIASAPGTYLLRAGDGVGAVRIIAQDGQVRLEHGEHGLPDVALHLTADHYVRLLAGRLDLAAAMDRGEIAVEGDRGRAMDLRRMFPGI